jgi:hypothetical protein
MIALIILTPHPLATSMAQSEDSKDKKPAPTPPQAIEEISFSLRPKITYREKAKYTSVEVIRVMAEKIYKRGDRDTEKAWRYGQQCTEKGVGKLPQPEQEEFMSLMLEAVRGLDESDQQIYQRLMEKSKTEQFIDYYEMRMIEFRFRGVAKLPDEKRRRAEALYNKAATLGTELP